MNALKIEIPKGFEVASFDKKTGEVKFKKVPEDITARIKDFSDVLDELGIDPGKFQKSCKGLSPDEVVYRQLKLIATALNEDWQPNWDDNNEYKYYPWFKMGSSGFRYYGYDHWDADSHVGSRLCFKTAKLAKYAGQQFEEIYKEYMIIQ